MSQHFFEFNHNGKECLLMSGWDKGPQMAYIVIGYYMQDKSDWEEPFILDTDIPFDRIANIVHLDEIIIHFKGILERLEISVPGALFDGVAKDIRENNSNLMYLYNIQGEQQKISENPFVSQI